MMHREKIRKVFRYSIVHKNPKDFFECFKIKKIKYNKFSKFYNDLNKPKIICTINFGRVGSQFLFENLNGKLDLLCGINLFNKNKKKSFITHGNFENFFFYSLKKVNYNNTILFEISPKRFLKLVKFIDLKILKIFTYHVIIRENILDQVMSFYTALNTGIWQNLKKNNKNDVFINKSYEKIKPKLFEILKNIFLFEKKISVFLRKNKISFLKQNYELIIKNKNYEANKFINFYKLSCFLLKHKIKARNMKKNVYSKKFNQIKLEFKSDKQLKLKLKKRIKI